jgi:Protein of unknown function (DUF3631)
MTGLAATLEDVFEFIRRYVIVTDHQAVALALWVLHTYAIEVADTTPYLAVTSPEKRSGKSLLMSVLQQLSYRPWRVIRPSEAVTFRKIERDAPTLLLDEVDTIFNDNSGQHEGLRALLNAGFQRDGSHIPRCVGPSLSLQEFSTFCAKAIAGIGGLPDTVADRSILIRMERKRPTDVVHRFRRREVAPNGLEMRSVIAEAVTLVIADLEDARPDLPNELDDRAADAWEPLFAIADVAGGEWPRKARAAAIALSSGRDDDEAGLAHRLLVDTHAVFTGADADKLPTVELIERLVDIETSPWGDLFGKTITPHKLGRMLKPYGIKTRHSGAFRGFLRTDFEDAWERYVTTVDDSKRPNRPIPLAPPKTDDSKPSSETAGGRIENPQNPPKQAERTLWTLPDAENGARRLTEEEEAEYERLLAKYPDLAAGGSR